MFNFLFLSKLIILIESLGSKDANYKIFISFVFTLRSSFVPTPPSLINNLVQAKTKSCRKKKPIRGRNGMKANCSFSNL